MVKQKSSRFENETVWLTQSDDFVAVQEDQSVISRHINNIFSEGELDKESNMQKMHIAFSDKPVAFYNLDVIISVGYQVEHHIVVYSSENGLPHLSKSI